MLAHFWEFLAGFYPAQVKIRRPTSASRRPNSEGKMRVWNFDFRPLTDFITIGGSPFANLEGLEKNCDLRLKPSAILIRVGSC